MVPALKRDPKDPAYDEAGPFPGAGHRLIRPRLARGARDAEAGLDAAKAVAPASGIRRTSSRWPKRWGQQGSSGARDAYVRGKTLAAARRDALDPDAPFWIVEANEALARLKP
jgi:hypothetical protein